MSWQQFRERANLYLFKSKERNLRILKAINIIITILAIGTIVWMYGFPLNPKEEYIAFSIIKTSFVFYVFHYLTKVVYDFRPVEFMKETWFEGIMTVILILEGLSYSMFDTLLIGKLFQNLGITSYSSVSTIIIQVYFFVVVVIEFIRNSELLPRIKLNPAFVFVLSFIAIIGTGTFLLMLPEMTYAGGISFIDALFTSTSATCVTGLLTVDPATIFTFKGQFVILALIKLGGLNIIAFGGFLALMSKFGLGVKHHQVIEGFVAKNNILSAKGMLGKVVLWTTSIEILGAIAMYYLWNPDITWYDNGQKIFYSVFHSVSAFNNAGIALFTDGFCNEMVKFNYMVHWVIIFQIFLGGIGILAIFDLFSPTNLRDRLKHPWKQIQYATKIALYVSLILIVGGSILIYFFEKDNTLAGQSFFGQVTGSVFGAVTPRTAGYNTVNYGLVSVPTVLLTIALMFIGASSGSTGGGIKTSSLAIIWADMRAVMTGAENTVLWKRTIPSAMKSTAYSVAIIYVVMNFIGAIILSITEGHILTMPGKSVSDLVFEQVSAFCTVGLSTGITGLLSESGKYVLVASMFIGRVGTFTIAFALAGRFTREKFKYPAADCMVG